MTLHKHDLTYHIYILHIHESCLLYGVSHVSCMAWVMSLIWRESCLWYGVSHVSYMAWVMSLAWRKSCLLTYHIYILRITHIHASYMCDAMYLHVRCNTSYISHLHLTYYTYTCLTYHIYIWHITHIMTCDILHLHITCTFLPVATMVTFSKRSRIAPTLLSPPWSNPAWCIACVCVRVCVCTMCVYHDR